MKEKGEGGLAGAILGNPTSRLLAEHVARDPETYGEIFVTDVKGGAVGATRKLTDFYQGDERDWQECFHRGRGRVWIEDRGYDRSAGTYVLGVLVPVAGEDGWGTAGVLKPNFNLRMVFNIITETRYQTLKKAKGEWILRTIGKLIDGKISINRQ